jgi:hypothetical protein
LEKLNQWLIFRLVSVNAYVDGLFKVYPYSLSMDISVHCSKLMAVVEYLLAQINARSCMHAGESTVT